jgi:hypothetical protein
MEKAMGPSAISLLSLLFLTASASLPRFVVPNFPDLTIKTRRTSHRLSSVDTLFLKGARQRSEILTARTSSTKLISITQCDARRRYSLDENWKTYDSFPIQDWQERMKGARPIPQLEMSGAEVIVTVDSVDTGERRQFGSFEARRVKTTTKVEPGPGAVIPARVSEVDGWYIDLPGFGCQESRGVGVGLTSFWPAGEPPKQDRVIVKQLGNSPRGIPIEETSRDTQRNLTTVSKVELLEFSEAPLDASLFELPAGYRPALRTPYSGRDMTKPDTLGNRLQAYWEFWTASARRWFRSLG